MPRILHRRTVLGPPAEPPADSPSELYHENTKLRSGLDEVTPTGGDFAAAELDAMGRGYKQYRRRPFISLPAPGELPANGLPFDAVVAARRTNRAFADADLEPGALGKLLHQCYGITGDGPPAPTDAFTFRSAPSAGALYPAEIYLAVRRVAGLQPGMYHYEVPRHGLALLAAGDLSDRVYEVCCRQEPARQAAIVVLIAGVMQRTKGKYGERGYRYVLLDVGHLAQNLYLASTALGLAVMTTGGFFDDAANALLHLDGVDETVLYVAFIGKSTTPLVAMASPADGAPRCKSPS